MNAIAIKKGPHGYYVDVPHFTPDSFGDPVVDESWDASLVVLHVKPANDEVEVTFDQCYPLITFDATGRKVVIYFDSDSIVRDAFFSDDKTEATLEEFSIKNDSSFWHFVKGKKVDT